MKLITWFLKFARAEKDETYSHHLVAMGLMVVTSAIASTVTKIKFHKDLDFSLGVGVCWMVLWAVVVWKPWQSAPEFVDLDKKKED